MHQRSKQQKLERILDNIEILHRIENRPNPTVWSRDIAESKGERITAGKVLSYLYDLDCIEKYWEGRSNSRYDAQSLDLEELKELTELFKPEKADELSSIGAGS